MGIFLYVDWAPESENTKASVKGRLEAEPKRHAWIPRKVCMSSGEHFVEVTEEWAKMANVAHLGLPSAETAMRAGLPPHRNGPTDKQAKEEERKEQARIAQKRLDNADW